MPTKKEKKTTKPEVVEDDAAGSGSEAEVEEKKPTSAAKKANIFALMADSDEEEEEEVEPDLGDKKKKKKTKAAGDDELSAMFGEKKKKKKEGDKKDDKKNDGDSKDEEKKDGEKKKKKDKKPAPIVCQVKEVMPVPKKDKLRVCKVCIAEGSPLVDIVTNAANVEAGKRFIVALPGVTTANGVEVKQAKVGGVESSGMFCGPQELGWETDVLDENMAVMLSESAEVGAPAPSYDEAVKMLRDREKAAAAEKQEAEAKGKKGKKKGAAKADEEDLDAVFAEFGLDAKEIAEAAAAKSKKGKKGKAAKPEDDGDAGKDDPKEESAKPEPEQEEEAPVELEKEEAVDPKAAAKGKKKDKNKGNTARANDDDFDAVLGEFQETAPPATAAEPPTFEAQEEENDKAGGAEDESTMDAKALANKRKKDKKKAKKGATGGEGMWGGAEEGEEGAAESVGAAVASSSKAAPEDEEVKPDPKKGAKKESATVKAARERMEMQKKLEEEKRKFEEEQRRLIEEEERKIREEEERIEAEKRRKREARLAKIKQQKEDGTFQTKKEKERARRAAQLREMFGFGIEDNEEKEDEAEDAGETQNETAAKPKVNKQSFAKKKKGGKKVDQEADDGKAVAEDMEEMKEPEPAKEEVQKAPAEAKAKEEDADGDDWEQVAEILEPNEEEPDAKEAEDANEAKANDEESDEESGSESADGNDSDSSGSSSDFPGYRSPIIVIMGHVDTGKTKLLDKIRRTNVQEGEAGGITQQIGATFFPDIALLEQTKKVDPDFDLEVPGIMIIDTPGHESFNNLRMRGSSLCDMAIVVIDIMHGLEPQTVESLEMLKKRRCPFIIALNKIDVCYQWSSKSYTGVREALDRQEQFVRDEFQQRLGNVKLQLNERGLNVALYWENEDPRSCVSIVPTSALTGEGVPDLLYQLLNLSQTLMSSQLEVKEELQCTVIEVKNIEGLGTTIDVILLNGTLKEGDQIVLAGLGGPIVTTIRALLTPQPMKEMRVKNEYVNHKKISTSMGVKICAPGLEDAVAGTELLVVGPDDDIEELKEEVSEGFDSILSEFQKEPEGVYVKASTLGSLEALITFLRDMKIPVFDVGIGEVHKKDVKKASIMKEKKRPEFAVILCFDVKVNHEANLQAAHDGVQIFTADIIYHLFDKFKSYMEKIHESKKTETRAQAVFPVILQIDKQYVFNKRDPFIFGCSVVGGQLRMHTPICVPEKDNLCIGHVGGIEKDHKPVQVARRGDTVCVKIEQNTAQKNIAYGRHFDHTNQLFSLITRESIDTLKENFKEEMQKSDWEMVIAMKKVFQIQ